MAYHCPKCDAKILSRRLGHCSVCEEPLPEDMLLSTEEAEASNKASDQILKQVDSKPSKKSNNDDDDLLMLGMTMLD